jgi:hypothetical protein
MGVQQQYREAARRPVRGGRIESQVHLGIPFRLFRATQSHQKTRHGLVGGGETRIQRDHAGERVQCRGRRRLNGPRRVIPLLAEPIPRQRVFGVPAHGLLQRGLRSELQTNKRVGVRRLLRRNSEPVRGDQQAITHRETVIVKGRTPQVFVTGPVRAPGPRVPAEHSAHL